TSERSHSAHFSPPKPGSSPGNSGDGELVSGLDAGEVCVTAGIRGQDPFYGELRRFGAGRPHCDPALGSLPATSKASRMVISSMRDRDPRSRPVLPSGTEEPPMTSPLAESSAVISSNP